MKITKQNLKELIKEELTLYKEGDLPDLFDDPEAIEMAKDAEEQMSRSRNLPANMPGMQELQAAIDASIEHEERLELIEDRLDRIVALLGKISNQVF